MRGARLLKAARLDSSDGAKRKRLASKPNPSLST